MWKRKGSMAVESVGRGEEEETGGWNKRREGREGKRKGERNDR